MTAIRKEKIEKRKEGKNSEVGCRRTEDEMEDGSPLRSEEGSVPGFQHSGFIAFRLCSIPNDLNELNELNRNNTGGSFK
jgi:hypothetical protein